MKSPWQFISDLANRRRQRLAEQSSEPTADDSPDRLLLPAPTQRREDVATKGDAESEPSHSERPPEKALQEETQLSAQAPPAEPAGALQDDDRRTSVAPQTSSDSQTEIVPKTKTRVARAAKPASRHKPDVSHTSGSIPEHLPVERTFHDDVRSVDNDIKRLKAELAAKLHVQNEQLRKMLDRFDRH